MNRPTFCLSLPFDCLVYVPLVNKEGFHVNTNTKKQTGCAIWSNPITKQMQKSQGFSSNLKARTELMVHSAGLILEMSETYLLSELSQV